jgi:hypothetical protein
VGVWLTPVARQEWILGYILFELDFPVIYDDMLSKNAGSKRIPGSCDATFTTFSWGAFMAVDVGAIFIEM